MFLLAASLLARPARAEVPAVDLGGKAYLRYSVDLTEGSRGDNAFAIDRVYLTARAAMSEGLRFRLTLDVGREGTQSVEVADSAGDTAVVEVPGEEKLQAFLKYAYVQAALPWDGVTLRAGMAPTAWVGFAEHFWGRRWISKSYTDQVGLMSSSDLGVQLAGRHGDGLLGWQAGVVNGEGYAHPEVDASKTAQARLDLHPVRGDGREAVVAAFGSYEWVPGADDVVLAGGGAGWDGRWLLAWGEVAARFEGPATGLGWSVVVQPQAAGVGAVFVRYDTWDPSLDAADDATDRLLAGAARELVEGLDLGLVYERSWLQGAADAPGHAVHLRAQARF